MTHIKNYFKDWSLFEKIWIILVCGFMTATWYINKDDILMLILTITGCLNLVLGAKGKIEGLYFAIINSVLYAWQCFGINLYGEVMYHVLFSIPISTIAIFLWRKNRSDSGEVKFKYMTKKIMAVSFGGTLVGVIVYKFVLEAMGGQLAFMDSLTTVVSVIASILYLYRFAEQWLMWVAVNALSIIMWIIIYINGDHSALIIIIMKCVYLLNSLYGYFNWKKIAKNIY
ncbi:nicotinamide mononucleotide transporter PnuC [Candidatus Epulonipiscium fishelsonii]|uniref:Nicotinamide mononucleotide transporter PnuC n=1 Tax=Candidatus Epulonipiscium fishelsonii TaxID=77094 RepID=A0ACC8XIW4_9FIRM|nr:nicotinamide mononucleotide transporter PnuC [Epulopiscium sp. SCG-D08WGA-EpuloA1]OON96106.1 MAG: nicotinamide mononucleotide transporter PnuC [Epulopiscium sp. AS2M-Bin002]